jgi:hypothetical protein
MDEKRGLAAQICKIVATGAATIGIAAAMPSGVTAASSASATALSSSSAVGAVDVSQMWHDL